MKTNALRSVCVHYSNGNKIYTSMAATLTDDEIHKYFAIGKWFNIGSVDDIMVQVTKVEIIK